MTTQGVSAIVLAAGFGTRLLRLTAHTRRRSCAPVPDPLLKMPSVFADQIVVDLVVVVLGCLGYMVLTELGKHSREVHVAETQIILSEAFSRHARFSNP